MTFKKRSVFLRAMFNDTISIPLLGKLSGMELWGMISVPIVILLAIFR